VLVEHAQPTAYCVAGRQPTVILTTGAVQALDPGQLDAVLAHERAHLTGRHHWLLAMARISREVLPFLPLMRDTEEQVARLVELHADDAATRARDPRLLATALVVLATAASPAAALAAGATDSVQRIHRLLGPSEPLGRVRRHLLRAAAAAGPDPSRARPCPREASGRLASADRAAGRHLAKGWQSWRSADAGRRPLARAVPSTRHGHRGLPSRAPDRSSS
jgi:hypothetical protein